MGDEGQSRPPPKRRRRKGALAAGVSGALVLALGVFAAFRWDDVVFAWYGYRLEWMPEGVAPGMNAHKQMNSSGQVAVHFMEDGEWKAARWSPGTSRPIVLGTLPGAGVESRSWAINERGSVAGTVYDADDNASRGFIWSEERGMSEIPNLGGTRLYPSEINGKEETVGTVWPESGLGRPFLWRRDTGTQRLGVGPGMGIGVNEDGWIVGNLDHHPPFLVKPGSSMIDLGPPPGFSEGEAVGINNRGVVLLNYQAGAITWPYLWTESEGLVPLSVPGDFFAFNGVAINDQGTVLLATAKKSSGHDLWFVLSKGGLHRLPVPHGFGSVQYLALNDRGWLMGVALTANGDKETSRRGFLARPLR